MTKSDRATQAGPKGTDVHQFGLKVWGHDSRIVRNNRYNRLLESMKKDPTTDIVKG